MINNYRLCLIFITITALTACTKGQPDFQVISEDAIPRPLFNQSTTKSIIFGSTTDNLPKISGTCDPKISSLKVQLVSSSRSFSKWTEMCDSEPTVTCTSNGQFEFTLKSLSFLGFNPVEDGVYDIEVRGVTTAGDSKPSLIRITYSTKVGYEWPRRITSGTTHRDTSTNGYSADIRITNMSNEVPGPQSSSSDFYLKTDGNPNGFSAHIGIKNNY